MSELSSVGNWQREKKTEKSGIRRKLKVSTLDIQIKRSGLKVSNSIVFSSDHIKFKNMMKITKRLNYYKRILYHYLIFGEN